MLPILQRNFIILRKKDIDNLLEMGEEKCLLMNDTIRDKYLCVIEFFSLHKKEFLTIIKKISSKVSKNIQIVGYI